MSASEKLQCILNAMVESVELMKKTIGVYISRVRSVVGLLLHFFYFSFSLMYNYINL